MQTFETDGSRLVWRGDGETLVVEPWGHDSLRVRSALKGEVVDADWALLPAVDTGTARVEIDGDVARLHHGAITAVLEQESWLHDPIGRTRFFCRVTFLDAAGQVLLRETSRGGSLDLTARWLRPLPGADLQLTASFDAVEGEKLYGMGLYQQPVLDLKGCTLELAHRNSQASVPFVLSSAGYGFLWHN
ncbi:MAG: family 31 glucosidase, partial [Cellulomonas sp.]|nr:family 31 glucosidase [Cellulomonas sp.]